MLGKSLRVPFRADDWIGTILVGSVLTLLVGLVVAIWVVLVVAWPPVGGLIVPLVALPSLVLRGYLLGVVRSGIRDDPTVDSFVRWGVLVRDGVRSTVISAIYLIPAAVLCGLALGGSIATVVDPDGFEGVVQAIAALVILTGGFGLLLYGMVYLYVRPAARAVFASTGSVRDALDVRRVVRLSITADYISGWLIAMGILVGGPALLVPLLAVSLAVAVVSPPLAFIGVLSTILLAVGTTFVSRVSAAYATGRGSESGLTRLSPGAVESLDSPTPQSSPPMTRKQPPEASAAVQTGRTVQLSERSAEPGETDAGEADQPLPPPQEIMPPLQPADDDLSGAPVYPRYPMNGSDPPTERQTASTDSDADATGDNPESTDGDGNGDDDGDTEGDDETEFVWGPTEE